MAMIERVALSIEGALPNQMKHLGPILARAAITAMREPTDAMIASGGPFAWEGDGGCGNQQAEHTRLGYQAMIDAALRD